MTPDTEADKATNAEPRKPDLGYVVGTSFFAKVADMADRIEELEAKNAALAKDSERLDWLEKHPRLGEIHVDGKVEDCYLYAVSGATGVRLRDIIDAVMGKATPAP